MFKHFFSFTLSLLILLLSPILAFAQEELQSEAQAPEVSADFSIPGTIDEFYDFARADTIMRLAVVLSDIYSKKDMEFTRGLLMGMQKSGMPENSVSLKLINGEIPEDSIQYELELFGPHVIISTFEKNSPNAVRTYTQENGAKVLNVFDTKGDDYVYNDNVFQILAPSDVFNGGVAQYILDNLRGNVLVLIGDPDPTDTIIRDLILGWPEEELMIISKADYSVFEFEEGVNYLIYPLYSTSDDIHEILKETTRIMADSPASGVKVFGKPNWIAISDLNSMIANMEAYIPVRCYFDPSADRSKRFIGEYNAMFGHAPIRSYPVYSVMGYDSATYFLPRLLEELRGEEPVWEPLDLYQSHFNIHRKDLGGYFNQGSYVLHYEPWGTMIKEVLN